MKDRLTNRSDYDLEQLENSLASALNFNQLLALAGQRLARRAEQVKNGIISDQIDAIDAGRDCSLAHTALEDALMRHNSAVYRIDGSWMRADPDKRI